MKDNDMEKTDIEQPQAPESAIKDTSGVMMEGHIRIFDPETGEDYVNKRNAIHNENMSEALALSIAKLAIFLVLESRLDEMDIFVPNLSCTASLIKVMFVGFELKTIFLGKEKLF